MTVSVEELQRLVNAVEGENLEFKEAKQSYQFDKLIRYCTALANEGGGRIILGVSDQRPRLSCFLKKSARNGMFLFPRKTF
jgi:ATP-dependent DNA helicase RecG